MTDNPRFGEIRTGGVLIAQTFDFGRAGPVIFPTPESAEMQCGFGEVDEEVQILPHVHNILERRTRHTSEFLYVIEGEIRIKFIGLDLIEAGEAVIGPQQGVLQYVGGHRITIAKGTRYFEIKQGPYLGHADDKTVLKDL